MSAVTAAILVGSTPRSEDGINPRWIALLHEGRSYAWQLLHLQLSPSEVYDSTRDDPPGVLWRASEFQDLAGELSALLHLYATRTPEVVQVASRIRHIQRRRVDLAGLEGPEKANFQNLLRIAKERGRELRLNAHIYPGSRLTDEHLLSMPDWEIEVGHSSFSRDWVHTGGGQLVFREYGGRNSETGGDPSADVSDDDEGEFTSDVHAFIAPLRAPEPPPVLDAHALLAEAFRNSDMSIIDDDAPFDRDTHRGADKNQGTESQAGEGASERGGYSEADSVSAGESAASPGREGTGTAEGPPPSENRTGTATHGGPDPQDQPDSASGPGNDSDGAEGSALGHRNETDGGENAGPAAQEPAPRRRTTAPTRNLRTLRIINSSETPAPSGREDAGGVRQESTARSPQSTTHAGSATERHLDSQNGDVDGLADEEAMRDARSRALARAVGDRADYSTEVSRSHGHTGPIPVVPVTGLHAESPWGERGVGSSAAARATVFSDVDAWFDRDDAPEDEQGEQVEPESVRRSLFGRRRLRG